MLSGLDAHHPDWFVPLPGVRYLDNECRPQRARDEIRRLWPIFSGTTGGMVLLNAPCLPSAEEIEAVALASILVLTVKAEAEIVQIRRQIRAESALIKAGGIAGGSIRLEVGPL